MIGLLLSTCGWLGNCPILVNAPFFMILSMRAFGAGQGQVPIPALSGLGLKIPPVVSKVYISKCRNCEIKISNRQADDFKRELLKCALKILFLPDPPENRKYKTLRFSKFSIRPKLNIEIFIDTHNT
jgi:hypothetical protein